MCRCGRGNVRLGEALAGSRFFRVSGPLQGEPDQIVRCVREFKLEGIVAKHRDSLYNPGMRSSTWRKIKLYQSAEFLAGGFVPNPEGTAVEALLVGLREGNTLRYAARVPLTFPVPAAETVSAAQGAPACFGSFRSCPPAAGG